MGSVTNGFLCLRGSSVGGGNPGPQGVLCLRQFRRLRPAGCLPQEEMALGLIACPDYQPRLHQHSYLRSAVILLLSLLMVVLGSLTPPTLPPPGGWRAAAAAP